MTIEIVVTDTIDRDDSDDDYHVLPTWDAHEARRGCWCCPRVDPIVRDDGSVAYIVTHRERN